MATSEHSLFESTREAEHQAIAVAQALGASLGITLDASGATEPGLSLKRQDDRAWATCRRPWSLMYFTAHGRALPCCIAPFSLRGYANYTLGDATQQEAGISRCRCALPKPGYASWKCRCPIDAASAAPPRSRGRCAGH